MLSCQCGRNRVVFSRDNVSEFEAASWQFEEEDGVVEEIEKRIRYSEDSFTSKYSLSSSGDDEGYHPYCSIDVVQGIKNSEVSDCLFLLILNSNGKLNFVNVVQSDESESETFRVKRRSISGEKQRYSSSLISPSFSEHFQVWILSLPSLHLFHSHSLDLSIIYVHKFIHRSFLSSFLYLSRYLDLSLPSLCFRD